VARLHRLAGRLRRTERLDVFQDCVFICAGKGQRRGQPSQMANAAKAN
jgi:hypothetical protein